MEMHVNHIMKWALLPLLILSATQPSHADEAEFPINEKTLKSWQLPEMVYPKENPYQKSVEELGKQLFFDPRLTGERAHSCASCHFPGTGWSDPLPHKPETSQGMERQAPTLINVAFQKSFFWDGRSNTLEEAIELHLKELSVARGELPPLPSAYKKSFKHAFGEGQGISIGNISKAIANFLRTIVVNNSPFDRWIGGEASAISQSTRKGFLLFIGKAECVRCHQPPNFSDSAFHNIGLNTLDPGHFDVSGNPKHRNAFRTSSLRQISRTPPYMHMGNKKNLMAVIEFYSYGGDRHGKDNELRPLRLQEEEEQQLLDFLMSLTGSSSNVTLPELPISAIP